MSSAANYNVPGGGSIERPILRIEKKIVKILI